jgi:hypothetical protein
MIDLEQILNQPMTRRQFLAVIGLGIVSVFGLPTILGVLTPAPDERTSVNVSAGYGSSSYGA